jgi:putative DNA primase/helicase
MKTDESTKPIFYENRKFLPNEFAKYLIDESGEYFVTPRDTEIIHRYDNGVYRLNGSPYIKEMVESAVDGKNITGKSVSEVLGHIQRRTYINRDEFDTGDNDILLLNGVLDTETFEFTDHDPKRYFLLQVPVKYDPDADCPKFKNFLDEVLPNKIERDTIIELFGYCLVKNYSIQKWFMFLGEGSNGKGTLLSTLRTFLGAENISAVELQEFEKPFSIAELYGRLANIVGDLSAKELYHSGRLKSLTGGDLLLAEKKFQNPFNFVNHAKLIYSANELPKTFDGTMAFWRRVMLINFTETFTNDGDIKDLWREFTTEEEMSGILNLAIEGVKRLKDNQQFTKDNSAEEVENHYIRNSDPVAAFFMDHVEITNDAEDYISLQTMHTAFVAYCRNYRFRDTSLRKFNSSIRKNYRLKESREINEETGKQDRVWTGVLLSSTTTNIFSPLDKTEKTEMTEDQVSKLGSNKGKKRSLSYGVCHSSHSVTGLNMMEFIQKKVSEYGDESDHVYNVITALLEKDEHPIDEIEYCIKLHRQGHRVYIPRKE